MGKHSQFESKIPYLHLNVLSAALQEVADAFYPLILNMVEMRHWEHCRLLSRGRRPDISIFHVNISVIDRHRLGRFMLLRSLRMPLGEWIGIASIQIRIDGDRRQKCVRKTACHHQ